MRYVTPSEVNEAERRSRRQRLDNAALMEIDLNQADEKERKLLERLMETTKGDGIDFDKALAHPAINDLFLRGLIKFRRPV